MSKNVAALIIVALALAISGTSTYADGRPLSAAANPELVSVNMSGDAAHGLVPTISGDGRHVAFWSRSDDIVPEDSNGLGDYFVYDRDTAITTRVNVSSDGEQKDFSGGGHAQAPAISSDGRVIAFQDSTSNLVADDGNQTIDIFVRDTDSKTTERVSVSSDGLEANGLSLAPDISGDGRFVAFWSSDTNLILGDTSMLGGVFVHDRARGTTERVSVASDGAEAGGVEAAINHDGRYVAFSSIAANLVAGDTNETTDIFVRDRETGTTERVSVGFDGSEANGESRVPDISADGRFVAFISAASNLAPDSEEGQVAVYVRDRMTGETELVGAGVPDNLLGGFKTPTISGDGRVVAFESGESPSGTFITVYDRMTGLGQRIPGFDPALSDDGRYVAYVGSSGPDPSQVSVFVYDRLVSPAELPETGGATVGTGLSPALLIVGFGLALVGAAVALISLRANSVKAPMIPARRRTAILLGAAVVAVLAVGGVGAYFATSSSDNGPTAVRGSSLPTATLTPRASTPTATLTPRASTPTATLTPRASTPTATPTPRASTPTPSPTSSPFINVADMSCESEIAQQRAETRGANSDELLLGGLYVLREDGSGLRCLAGAVQQYRWSPDAKRVAAIYYTPYTPPPPTPPGGPQDPAWLDFTTPTPGPETVVPTLEIIDVERDRRSHVYVGHPGPAQGIAWSPDSKLLAFYVSNQGGGEAVTETWVSDVEGVVARLVLTTEERSIRLLWLGSDQLGVVASDPHAGRSRLLLVDIISDEVSEALKGRRVGWEGVSWSLDAGLVAVAAVDGDQHTKLLLVDPVSGEVSEAYETDGRIDGFSWSPDGERIAVATPEQRLIVSLDGFRTEVVANLHSADERPPRMNWSPNGQSLLLEIPTECVNSGPDCPNDILITEIDGTPRVVAQGADAQWSPDGSMVLFRRGELCSWRWDIMVLDVSSGVEDLVSGDYSGYKLKVQWVPTTGRISFYNINSDDIYIAEPFGDETVQVAAGAGLAGESANVYVHTWSPDGSLLLLLGRELIIEGEMFEGCY